MFATSSPSSRLLRSTPKKGPKPIKETRTAAEAAYRSLVDTVNALAMINGDAEYATFIDHVNAMIERQKAISKARTTRAKKEDEKPGEL